MFRDLWHRSLKIRITVIMMVIFVVSLWLLSFYAVLVLRQDMHRLLGEQQFATVSFVATSIDEELKQRVNALESSAKLIDATLMNDPVALRKFIEVRPPLQNMFNGGIVVCALDGTVLADAPYLAGRRGLDYGEIDVVATALKKGMATIGGPAMAKVSNVPIVGMAAPIRDARGHILGALAGIVDLSAPNFLDKLTTHRYGQSGGYLLIAPQSQRFVTATDKSRIMQPLPAPGLNAMHDKYQQGYEGYGVAVNSRGVEELTAAKRIPSADWRLGIALPTHEAFAPLHSIQKHMLIATITLTLAAGLLIWRMLMRQFSPLASAVDDLVGRSTGHQIAQALAIARPDEIGQLIAQFNQLLTALWQREDAMRHTEGRLKKTLQQLALLLVEQKTILDNELVGIVKLKKRQFVWVNPAFEKIVGWPPNELIGQDIRQCYPDEASYRSVGEIAYSILSKGEIFRSRLEMLRKDGRTIWTEVSGALMENRNGESLWTFYDISDRVKAENELKRSNAELEQFSYAISHDMRQPLRMIASYLQLLDLNLGEKLDSEHRDYLNYAADGAKRLDRMLVALLEYSRVGRIGEPRAWIASRTLIDEAQLYLHTAVAEASAHVSIDGDWPHVFVSHDEFVRLLQNLLDNALKFRVAERTPEIVVHSETLHGRWRVSISDNGVGIYPHQIDRLFQVFQRLQSRADYEGTGVGLALCRKIVEHHGGKIWAESAGENRGARFCVELPLPAETT
ncbi:MAG TPA: ATP-binding protein [Rhodocyclaceae bacterium]|nr:ATP-binding protein [Rhodocyclaceae bacterium]